jgi:ketopantoate reductase
VIQPRSRAKKTAITKSKRTKKSLDKIALFPYDTKSSLQMDFEKKKNTELDIFTGYIVNFAKEHELDVPVHEKVYNVLCRKTKKAPGLLNGCESRLLAI